MTLVATATSTGAPFDADASLRGADVSVGNVAIDNANAVRCGDCGQSRGWGLQR